MGKVLIFDETPTWLLVELFVKPLTEDGRVPFVDVVSELWSAAEGPKRVEYFVSHDWGSSFMNTLKNLEDVGTEASSFWLCCFALTQAEEKLELLSDMEVFDRALQIQDL